VLLDGAHAQIEDRSNFAVPFPFRDPAQYLVFTRRKLLLPLCVVGSALHCSSLGAGGSLTVAREFHDDLVPVSIFCDKPNSDPIVAGG
jgi:hypothetical protein